MSACHIFHIRFKPSTPAATVAPVYWVTLCPWCSLLASAASWRYKPICITESPLYHKSLTMESAVILTPKGSYNPSSCHSKVISPWYCFQAHLTCFPQRMGAVWMHLADLHVLAPILQVSRILAGTSGFLLRWHSIWSQSHCYLCLLPWCIIMLWIQTVI